MIGYEVPITGRKIMIIGNYGNRNIGDESVLDVLLNEKNFKNNNIKIIIPSRNPKLVEDMHQVKAIKVPSLKLLWEFFSSDTIIISGGDLFSNLFGFYIIFIPIIAILARLIGKKVIYYSIGIYPSSQKSLKVLLLISILFANCISVRDEISLQTIRCIKKIKKIHIVPDPALKLKPIRSKNASYLLRREGIKKKNLLIGLSLKCLNKHEVDDKVINVISKFINWLIKWYNADIVFFPFEHNKTKHYKIDYFFGLRIKQNIQNKNKFKIIKGEYTPAEIMGMIGKMDFFVGMRYHSLVFAYKMKVPFIGIAYAEKTDSFLKSIGKKSINVYNLNFNKLKQEFKKLSIGFDKRGY